MAEIRPAGRHMDLRRRHPAGRPPPGRDKSATLLREPLGEPSAPPGALAGGSFQQGKKSELRPRPRRLREPGDLHESGVLTDEGFTMAGQAALGRA